MVALRNPFVASDHRGSEYSMLPEGVHPLVLLSTEKFEPRSGGTPSLALKWEVTDGPSKGDLARQFISLWHASDAAAGFARRQLAAVMDAAGIEQLQDTEELVGCEVVAHVRHRTYTDQTGQERRQIEWKKFEPRRGPNAPTPLASAPATDDDIPF